MVIIRLSRGGSKKRPFYQIVVADSRRARDGRFIEKIGYFNPISFNKEKKIKIDINRLNYWIGLGAKKSDIISSILKKMK
ncbi:MAG: 30S ribosomal protein S16 [Arsenophonus sp.]|nr:MAG: 30S ribosomal protein S16 [Arsenophonus sp.]